MFDDENTPVAGPAAVEWQPEAGIAEKWSNYGATWLPKLLDEFAFGIAVVDVHRRLLYSNRIADIQLREHEGLSVEAGILEGRDRRDTRSLQNAVDLAIRSQRSYLAIGASHPKVEIAVLPMSGSGALECEVAAIIFEKSTHACRLGLYFFAQAYRLTQAEERLLGCLESGVGVAEAAAIVGCAPSTARTHVRSILTKTAEPSLRALASRVGRLPPIAARTGIAQPPAEGC